MRALKRGRYDLQTNSVRIKLEFVDLIKQGNCQEKYSLKGWFYSLKQLTKLSPRSKKVFLMFGQDIFFSKIEIIDNNLCDVGNRLGNQFGGQLGRSQTTLINFWLY